VNAKNPPPLENTSIVKTGASRPRATISPPNDPASRKRFGAWPKAAGAPSLLSQRLSGDNRRWQIPIPVPFRVAQGTIVIFDDYGQSRLMKATEVLVLMFAAIPAIRTSAVIPVCPRTSCEAIDAPFFGVAA
jgi:hypothetical protein